MRSDVASVGTSVAWITSGVVALTIAFVVIVLLYPRTRVYGIMPIVATALGIIVVWCFLRAPIAYELAEDALTVIFRIGSRRFDSVTSCKPIREPVSFAVRVFGNGGLFAVTGLYKNKELGLFRAYVTDPTRLVLVETAAGKPIVISPANAEDWLYVPEAEASPTDHSTSSSGEAR